MGVETIALLGLGAVSAVSTVASMSASRQNTPAPQSKVDYSVLNTVPEPNMPVAQPQVAQAKGATVKLGDTAPEDADQQIKFVDPAKVQRKSTVTLGNIGRGGLKL